MVLIGPGAPSHPALPPASAAPGPEPKVDGRGLARATLARDLEAPSIWGKGGNQEKW